VIRRASPSYELPPEDMYNPDEPKEDDSEARSVFVSQLAARLTARDLGYFFEDKLGEGSVMDARIVTDRLSRRSKGCAYSSVCIHHCDSLLSELVTLNSVPSIMLKRL
jgi:RNA-binding protein 39